MPRDRRTPDVFEVYIGSFSSPSYGVWWDGKQLVYESFVSGYEDRRQTFIEPSAAQWDRFWRTMEAINVWRWSDRYEARKRFDPAQLVRDGTHWSLSLTHEGRRVESAGESASVGSSEVDGTTRFDEFAEAVSRLTGGYTFA